MIGAKEGLARLRKAGLRYYLISRRRHPETAIKFLKVKKLWSCHFNNQNCFFVSEAREKNEAAKKLGVNFYLDDELHVLASLTSVKNRSLFDPLRAHRDLRDNLEIKKVETWKEFLKNIFND